MMRTAFGRAALAAGCVGLSAGCVDRRFVVDTNVPGAQISLDGRPIGPSPVDSSYVYAGGYEFRAVAPGYEPLTKLVRLRPRWYDYPGLDFFAEVVYPGRIEDVRHIRLDLQPAAPVRTDELLGRADELRARAARDLPEPTVPDDAPGPVDGRVNIPPAVVPPGPRFPAPQTDPLRPAVPTLPGGAAAPQAGGPARYGSYSE